MRTRAVLLSLLALAAAYAPRAEAGPWLLAPGEYYTQFEAGRSFADTYMNADGDRGQLSPVNEQRSLSSYIELGWKKRVSFVLAAPITSVTNRVDGTVETATGLGDLHTGFRYRVREGATALAIQGDIILPLGYQTTRPTALGDGLQDWGLTAHYGGPIRRSGFAQGSVGYAKRFMEQPFASQKDSLIPSTAPNAPPGTLVPNPDYQALHHQDQVRLGADVGWWLGKAVLLSGHYRGDITVSHGDASPDETTHFVGPEIRFRVDPRLDLIAGSNHLAAGRQTMHPDEYYVGVAYRQTKLNRLQGFLGNSSAP